MVAPPVLLVNPPERSTLHHRIAVDRVLTLTVAVGTFLLRWLTLDFDNDYFMHMAWAAEMLRGEWPVRDFVEPGFPLQTWLAYGGLRLGGYQLAWEGFTACAFIAASTALIYSICRGLGVARWLSLLVVLVAAVTFPRLYAYPKAFVYPAALWALMHYVRRPNRVSLVLAGLVTAVAFLFRHDHGVWIVPPTVAGLAIHHWRQPHALTRAVAVYGAAGLALVAPWLVWVAVSGHAAQYFGFLVERSEGLTDRARLPVQTFEFNRAAPLASIAPIEYPIVGIRWATDTTPEMRRSLEQRYRLVPLTEEIDRYRLTSLDSDNVRRLVFDSAVEDTSGIDRASLRVPDGAFAWLYLQLQKYIPVVRLRLLPGYIRAANAEPWLTDVTFFTPWAVLTIELLWFLTRRQQRGIDWSAAAIVVPAAVLSILTYQTLVRASPDSRLGDIAALTAVLLAWGIYRTWNLQRGLHLVTRPLAVAVLVLTVGSALIYGRVIPRAAGVGVDGPTNLVRRLSGVGALYSTRPLDLYAPPDATGLARLARWLNECTAATDRVALIGFEPQVFFLSERGFAGGLAFYDLGWNSSGPDQALVVERWSGQQVPVVLAMDSEWESFSRDYPAIRGWIDAQYDVVRHSAFEGGKPLTVLVHKSQPRTHTHATTELPCFR